MVYLSNLQGMFLSICDCYKETGLFGGTFRQQSFSIRDVEYLKAEITYECECKFSFTNFGVKYCQIMKNYCLLEARNLVVIQQKVKSFCVF